MTDFKHKDISKKIQDNGITCISIRTEIINLLNKKTHSNVDFNKAFFLLFEPLLEKSFTEKVVLAYNEYTTVEKIMLLHNFFSNHACNIQNICLIQSSIGTKDFYDNYCNLINVSGMEIFFVPSGVWDKYFTACPEKHFDISKQISYLFNFYGGSYEVDPPERTFLSLFASQFEKCASVEFLGQCSTKQALTDWLEYKTFFMDQPFVEKYQSLYDTYVQLDGRLDNKLQKPLFTDATPVKDEIWELDSYQEQCDRRVLFNLVRETSNFEPMVHTSEKTFRCFINHVIPIPVGGVNTIETYKDLGFWIDTDFVDYSYLKSTNFVDRMHSLDHSLNELAKIPVRNLQNYYQTNKKKFIKNQKLAFDIRNHTEIKIDQICKYIKEFNETHVS